MGEVAVGGNGANSMVSVPNDASLNPGTATITITAKVNFTVVPSRSVGLRPRPQGPVVHRGRGVQDGDPSELRLHRRQRLLPVRGLHQEGRKRLGQPHLADGDWHTITCIKSATSIKLIVDGVTRTKNVSLGSISNTSTVTVGARTVGGDQYRGDIDEVSILLGSSHSSDRGAFALTRGRGDGPCGSDATTRSGRSWGLDYLLNEITWPTCETTSWTVLLVVVIDTGRHRGPQLSTAISGRGVIVTADVETCEVDLDDEFVRNTAEVHAAPRLQRGERPRGPGERDDVSRGQLATFYEHATIGWPSHSAGAWALTCAGRSPNAALFQSLTRRSGSRLIEA